ncbi:OmpA family protein [uncultured Thiothrix sp.]|uniref:OmpA family protein n=1 Tax=uncultured Thiothrix sp. TaxID=223185 RepID=UPI00260AFBAF|nr:OmpA family protein [uncultured Thiothrix sp.]
MLVTEALDSDDAIQQTKPQNPPATEHLDALEQLRVLLLGADYQTLSDLRQQLLDRERYSLHVAEVISEALTLRAQQDNSLAEALSSTIETAVSRSVENNPSRLANALYPVMGPAIRRSIQEVLQQALETFNYLLEQSLSLRSLFWRFDAWRTGRSYSEVVLLKTLVYQVEQVFLIHRESGLLLQHAVSPQAISKDPDIISAMLTAIQDFIRDSFQVSSDNSLKTLQLAELTVFFNQGPYATMAAVVRGNPPAELTTTLTEVNEQIHRQSFYFLKTFQGDTAVFKRCLPLLERCLKTQLRYTKKFPWLAILALITFTGAGVWWSYQYYQHKLIAEQALSVLRAEPGLVVVGFEKTSEGYQYEILKDPQAREPATVIQSLQTMGLPLKLQTKPYLSLEPEFVLARAKQILQPPAQVKLSLEEKALVVEGQATPSWQQQLMHTGALISGVESLEQSKLQVIDPAAEQLAERLRVLVAQIETLRFSFSSGSSALENVQEHAQQATTLMLDLLKTARLAGKMPQVSISGSADETGSEFTNGRLAKERALAMRDYLLEQGVPAVMIAVPKPDNGHRNERSVHYQVDLF